jgi:hypothetical protein
MVKMILIGVATALPTFAAGVWTKSTVLATSALVPTSTISPSEMHLKMNPSDLPVQYVDAYN